MISPKSLQPNPWNTNVVDADNERRIEASIRELGFFRPIVVRELPDGTLEILGGQHRAAKAIEMGIAEVPVMNLGPIGDDKAKKIGLADNARYGHDDTLKLAELLKDLGGPDELQKILPLSDDDLAAIFAASSMQLDDLDKLDDKKDSTPAEKAGPTHQVMRFKVPIEDVAWVTTLVEQTMKREGYIGDDSLTNAGNAFVHIMKGVRETA
jgi:ParB-like chromosome segregation protein Spo0J